METGQIIVISGVMAAGKSTVAQLLAERSPRSVHLRGDVFRRIIVRGRAEPTPELSAGAAAQLTLRYRVAATVARQYAEASFLVVYQDVILEDDLARVAQFLQPHDVRVVVLCPGPAVVAQREAARSKFGYGHPWTVAALDAALGRTPRLGLWLDNAELTPEDTVDSLLAQLDAARVPS
jgi:predicted kinase